MTDKTTAEHDAAQFTACDMATASAQGFRAGRASVPLPGAQEAVVWRARRPNDSWILCSKELHDRILSTPSEWPGCEAQALYAAPQPALSAGWQPIETAPKDGTPLLLRSKKGRIADGAWITATSSCGGWAWAYINLEPVEWQALPVAPSMDGESK